METQTLSEKLIESRIVRLFDDVHDETADHLITSMLYMDTINHKPINLHINSPGGEIYSLLGIIDTMDLVKSPVHTVCTGLAASAASVILACGSERYITKNSTVMIHQPRRSGGGGTCAEIQINAAQIQRLHTLLSNIYVQRTKMTSKKVEELLKVDTWLNAGEALKLGLVDEII